MRRIQQINAIAAVCAGCEAHGPIVATPSPKTSSAVDRQTCEQEWNAAAARLALEAGWKFLQLSAICPACARSL